MSERRTSAVVVVGSANMDIVGRVPHLPAEGETVLGSRLMHAGGGKGANQAVAASRAGSAVTFIARLGDDGYGADLRQSLVDAGVNVDHVVMDPTEASGVALILVDDDGNNSIAVLPGANGRLTSDDIERSRAAIESCSVLVVQLEIPMAAVEHAARIAHAAGATIILNPAPARELDPSFLELIDVIVPNRDETGRLSGVGSPVEPAAAARLLTRAGVGTVVVTLGAEGAVVVTASSETPIPPFVAQALDTTGAGDAFVGNLASRLASGDTVETAARFAAAAAALSVQRPGAQPSMPTAQETHVLMEEA